MQLGKLDVFEPVQEVGCKTTENRTQSDQTVSLETQNAQILLSFAASALRDRVFTAQTTDDLDAVAQAIWSRRTVDAISDEEAEYLQSCVDRLRPHSLRSQTTPTANVRVSWFKPRQRARSPDLKASRDRRRKLGGSSALPHTLRPDYTEGQRSVLCIITGEIKRQGICDLSIGEIAARAGVCPTTVQTTLHEARLLGHIRITQRPVRGSKHKTNLVQILDRAWIAWLKRRPANSAI